MCPAAAGRTPARTLPGLLRYVECLALLDAAETEQAADGGRELRRHRLGRQLATSMLTDAGLTGIEVHEVESDAFNLYYVARKS